jgi:putative membrane protein
MGRGLINFLVFWGVHTLLLWVASQLFASVRFDTPAALLLSGLLFGVANALLKPLLVVLTLPITVVTLGLFLLIINAAILLLVAWLVPGFHLAGFWPAVGVGLFISVLSFFLSMIMAPVDKRT